MLLGATMIKGLRGERFTYTASGTVTNVAARLCDLGSHGEVHLSEATAQLVRDRVMLQGPCETGVKNIHGTLPVYKLVTCAQAQKEASVPCQSEVIDAGA